MRKETTHGKRQPSRDSPRSLPRTGDTTEFSRQCKEVLCVETPGVAYAVRHRLARRSHRDHQERMEPDRRRRAKPSKTVRQRFPVKEEEMNANAPPDCHLCNLPIFKGTEVFLNKETFHPNCAVVAAKEKKHGSNAHDTRRSKEGNKAGTISCANSAINRHV